ncbi:hypothetical protein JQT66_19055 [Sulfitobacter mediterraneus]|uniref:hypothetical protein n=1 Tax=Sulfitobacter mediterraneus TaxID=83219 RepID=UPI001931A187|nr:hypothetical protein [Sulfitobacter mediterraneus]MBM1312279.1 hypothetical protein [Sulfitobacter mediterraneus]MBM1316157.1 hypothetical protein [Sulfitobacter mediterraneus]MBM1324522.1 hypothetical protein [Sulfitobacter mediterraneus]MBM1328433.1 hypothetical protein [Sulfitobacter mediterraneus]MBM1399783.1 hypothetical protein [Sulfitobacter mediterraneus]
MIEILAPLTATWPGRICLLVMVILAAEATAISIKALRHVRRLRQLQRWAAPSQRGAPLIQARDSAKIEFYLEQDVGRTAHQLHQVEVLGPRLGGLFTFIGLALAIPVMAQALSQDVDAIFAPFATAVASSIAGLAIAVMAGFLLRQLHAEAARLQRLLPVSGLGIGEGK